MTQNAKAMLIALIPNGMFVCALFGWMAGRISAGEGPFPHGWTPAVMALCGIVPMLSVAASTAVSMAGRRDGC
jgi:hypothetical protein